MSHLIDPGLWLWLALGLWSALAYRAKRRGEALRVGALFLLFWVIGGSSIPHRLLASLENEYPTVNLDALAPADAIVVLGGGYSASSYEPTGLWCAGGSALRPLTALELVRKQKAPVLVMTGNTQDSGPMAGVIDADRLKKLCQDLRITDAELVTVGDCHDTRDEAVAVGKLAKDRKWKRVLLVTSAAHMHRAQAVFQKSAGVEVTPVAVDYSGNFYRKIRLKPDVGGGLQSLFSYIHELAGRLKYRAAGWT